HQPKSILFPYTTLFRSRIKVQTDLAGYFCSIRDLSRDGSKQNVRCGYAFGKSFTSARGTGLLEVIRSFRVTYIHGHHPRSERREDRKSTRLNSSHVAIS